MNGPASAFARALVRRPTSTVVPHRRRMATSIVVLGLLYTAISSGSVLPTPVANAATTLAVTSSIPNGATLSGRVTWTANVAGATSVTFYIDGALRWTEAWAPYQYNGDPGGLLDTATLSNGTHSLRVDATASGASGSTTASVTISNGGTTPPPTPAPTPTPTPPPPSGLSVTSSIANGATLSGRVTWTATATGSPTSVTFYIDGALRWTEGFAPYQYNGDPGGQLDTATLSNGGHSLQVTATTSAGSASATSAVTIANGSATPAPTPVPTATPSPAPTPPPAQSCTSTLQSLINNAAAGSTLTVPACVYHEAVTVTKALTLSMYGAVIDGDNVRRQWMTVRATGVTIKGATMRNAAAGSYQEGSLQASGSVNLQLIDVHLSGGTAANLAMQGGSGLRITNCEIDTARAVGATIGQVSDIIVTGSRIHDNNTAGADPGDEAGGIKIGNNGSGITVSNNEVYHNGGLGIWFDVNANTVTVTGNRIHHNAHAGINFEVSNGAVITGNNVWENGWSNTGWGWGAGIVLSSSSNAEVARNIVAWNGDDLSVVSQNRPGFTSVTGNYVHDNTVVRGVRAGSDSTDRPLLGWLQDWPGIMYNSGSNNRGTANLYWSAGAEPEWCRFVWNGSQDTIAKFNATPGDEGGRYLSTAERDAALSAVGIPLSQEAH